MALRDYKSSLSRYRRYLALAQEKPLVKESLSVILSLTLVIVLVVAALRPTIKTIASLLNEIKQKKEIIARLDLKNAQIIQAQSSYQMVQPRLSLLDEALPKLADLKSWISSIEKIATDSGVKVGLITLGPAPVGKIPTGLTEINFSVATDSEYKLARQFVDQIEKIRRLVKINTVQLDKSTKEKSGVNLTINGVLGEMYEEKAN